MIFLLTIKIMLQWNLVERYFITFKKRVSYMVLRGHFGT